ncbi:hypothetical protein FRC17_001443 [Serendipita sp. 399]|nr:hypothetical protein FRC17_001443 [Serendipita sp. 399]
MSRPYQYAKTDTSTAPYAHLPIQLDDNINTHPSNTPGSSQPLVYSPPPTIYSSGDYRKRPSQHPNQRSSSFDENGLLRPDNLTRFTLPWFKYRLKQQVRRKRLGRLLYVISGFVLLLIWLTITVFFGYHLESSEASNSSVYANSQLTGPPSSHGEQEQEHGISRADFDSLAPSSSLDIDWSAFYAAIPLNPKNLLATQVDIDRRNDTVPLAMFRDVLAVPDKETNITDYQPFRIQNPHVKPAGFLGLTQFGQINTNIALGQRSSNIWLQPEFGYPFDVFRGTIVWVAANNETITRTGRPGTDVRPISGAVLTDSLLYVSLALTLLLSHMYTKGNG